MELDFDKEMDAILRQAAKDSGRWSVVGDQNFVIPQSAIRNPQSDHLDADEISAFSENTLPEKTRAVYMSHLADCDRCRTILSNLILLNSETENASSAAAVPVIAETSIPWYRRIFAAPNLAYALGGLVILFGGFIGFLVFQSANNYQTTEVSQISGDEQRVSGPNVESGEFLYNSNAATAVNMSNMASTNSAANTSIAMSNTAAANANISIAPAKPTLATPTPEISAKESREETKQLAEQQNQDQSLPRVLSANTERDAETADLAIQKRESSNLAAVTAQPAPAAPAGRAANDDKKLRARKSLPAETAKTDSESANTRQISGKTFNRKDGVWYDAAYSNQKTTNIRRNTDDYRKLDSGLRVIAESLQGTVVVVWKEKAYRIQ